MPRVLVLGGGFGGLTVASQVADRRLPNVDVTVVDQRSDYVMGLAKLWALDGRRPLSAGRRDYRALESRGVHFQRGTVRKIDLARRSVQVDDQESPYDYLVVALGAEMAPERLPGFAPTMDLYTQPGVEHLHRQLQSLNEGRVLVMVTSMPFKCPPAPYEAALLLEAMLRKRGVRKKVELRLTTPEPHPLPVAPPQYGKRLIDLLVSKRIDYRPNHHPTLIDATSRLVHYQNGEKVNFDVLVGVPMHRAPGIVREAGLGDATGWIPVDPATLRTRHPNVWAVGDVASIRLPNGKPLPKAGTIAANQGHVAAQHIAAAIEGRPSAAAFGGHGVCYVEVGDGLAVPARGSFYARPEPVFELGVPSSEGLREKEQFEADFLRQWFG